MKVEIYIPSKTDNKFSQDLINTSNKFETPKANLEWKDYLEVQNQYRDLISQGYRDKNKQISLINGSYLRQQIKENEVNKRLEEKHNGQDAFDTLKYDSNSKIYSFVAFNIKVLSLKMIHYDSCLATQSQFQQNEPEWNDPAFKYFKKEVQNAQSSELKVSRLNLTDSNIKMRKGFLYPLCNSPKRKE